MSEQPVVVGIDDQDDHPIDLDRWTALAGQVLLDEGISGASELNLTFIDTAEMTGLNVEHMGGTGPTDVLSFPLDRAPTESDPTGAVDGQPCLLGDIMICPQIVHAQAPGDPDDELALMVVHGVLHILGMDHAEPEETAQMKAAEQRHLDRWRSS